MKFDPDKHNRRSIRLKNYDYSQPGAYFITIVTQDRTCLFGAIADGAMRLNDAGRMVERWWLELHHKFPTAKTDQSVIMPKHFHGIVVISVDSCFGPNTDNAGPTPQGTHAGVPLPTIVQ